ncbi:YncE family protein [Streptomyces sp. ISL-44]|uniref:YncE family protein n=1 Tax=Streptomyces sp. ISL-44 TaxID=2819184 RepID=UPI002034D166|nr:YncE family protein [Streptomyces sp. ISL-44]
MSNTEKRCVVATIPVGTGPVGVAVDVHDHVFVTNSGDNTVLVIDALTNTVTATINVGLRPESVATDPQFGVYVANGGFGTVSVIDRFNTVIATINVGGPPSILDPPSHVAGVAVDHFLSRAYVTSRSHHRVAVIGISGELSTVAPDFIDVHGPLGVAVDSANHRVYVTQPDLNTVSVIDAATNGIIATIPVRQHPMGISIDSQRRRAYVANSGFKTVSVIDIVTGAVADIEVGVRPIGVAVDSRGDAYITHSDGTVKVIDAESSSVSATIPVGSQPEGVAFEPHSNRVYVANRGDGTVSAIDLARS